MGYVQATWILQHQGRLDLKQGMNARSLSSRLGLYESFENWNRLEIVCNPHYDLSL